MIKIFILFLLSACASSGSVSFDPIPNGTKYELKHQDVSSDKEAIGILTNKRNFLLSLFEQSVDPYYGTPRWQESCLKENVIGEIQKTDKGIFFASRLTLNAEKNPGFCFSSMRMHEKFAQYHVVHFHCFLQKKITALTIAATPENPVIDWKNLCR